MPHLSRDRPVPRLVAAERLEPIALIGAPRLARVQKLPPSPPRAPDVVAQTHGLVVASRVVS